MTDRVAEPGAATWLGFVLMCAGMFMAILDIQVVATSLPAIQDALAISRDAMSWIQTAYLIAEIIAIPLTGWFTRVLTLRWLFVIAIGVFTLTSIGCEGKYTDRNDEQPPQRQHARKPPGQRNGDDLGDQIRRLNPAHRISRYRQRILDRGQRGRDDLNVENRHEHADAHQDETKPRGSTRLGNPVSHYAPRTIVSRAAARARFSDRMRIASTAALRIVKKAASSGRPSTNGSTAISAATTA